MLTTSSEWGEMVTKLTVPKEWKGLFLISLPLCKAEWRIYTFFIQLSLTHLSYLLDAQSGRYMHCCFACSWRQWYLHTCSSRTRIRFGSCQWVKIREDQRLVFLEIHPLRLLRIIISGTWTYRLKEIYVTPHETFPVFFLFLFSKLHCMFYLLPFHHSSNDSDFFLTVTLLFSAVKNSF